MFSTIKYLFTIVKSTQVAVLKLLKSTLQIISINLIYEYRAKENVEFVLIVAKPLVAASLSPTVLFFVRTLVDWMIKFTAGLTTAYVALER